MWGFFQCLIAKPKSKSLLKQDKTFPFLCKPKPNVTGKGKEKGIFSSVSCHCSESFSHSPCEKAFSPSPFHITQSSGQPAFRFLVHSQVNAILTLSDISSESVSSIEMAGVRRCVRES